MNTPNRAVSPSTLDALSAFDTRLARYGLHGLTPFWAETIARFYGHPTAKRLVARVGRGGAKSFTAVRVACFETLTRDWAVPEGEVHFFAIVSALKEEAAQRRRMIRATLDALGIEYESAGDEIVIPDRRVGFRVFASTGEAVRGFRCIGYVADELAFWPWDTNAADPAGEVLASLDAMCITHPEARSLLISSPWSVDDAHAVAFDLGDTEHQVTAYAETWTANRSTTREDCLQAAKGDASKFRRDYEAIPGATVAAAFDAEDLNRAFDRAPGNRAGEPVIGCDPSSMSHDSFAWCVAQADEDAALCILWAASVDAQDHQTPVHAVARIAEDADTWGARRVFADQYASAFISKDFEARKLNYNPIPWTADTKRDAVEVLRRLLREGRVSFVAHPRLKSELYGLKRRLAPQGKELFDTNGKDFLSTVLAVCTAIAGEQFALEGFGGGYGFGTGGSGAAAAVGLARLATALAPGRPLDHYEAAEIAETIAAAYPDMSVFESEEVARALSGGGDWVDPQPYRSGQ
jgi:hypothetical protein